MNHVNGQMIPAGDVASIAAATTITDGAGFVSHKLPVWDTEWVVFQGHVTGGNASASGQVDFNIVGTVDGVLWDTVTVLTLTITMAGVAQIVQSDPVDVSGLRMVKIKSIQNKDATYTATLVGLHWGKAYGY